MLELRRISPLHTFIGYGDSGACDSLLYYAVDYKWEEGVALFMLYGGDPATHELHRRKTALEYALENAERGANNSDYDGAQGPYVLALLGRWPVDAPLIAGQGVTALMYASEHGHAYALQLLLQRYGANVHLRDPMTGANALFYAMRRVEAALRRRHERYNHTEAQPELPLDAALAILVGPLDPVQYQSRFPFAMANIRRHASVMRKTAE